MENKILIILDHGSRSNLAQEDLDNLCANVAEMGNIPCFGAHLEIAKPDLIQAIEQIKHKTKEICVFPLFLAQGRHLSEDVPELIQKAQNTFPNIEISLLEGLRNNPLLIKLIINSIM